MFASANYKYSEEIDGISHKGLLSAMSKCLEALKMMQENN